MNKLNNKGDRNNVVAMEMGQIKHWDYCLKRQSKNTYDDILASFIDSVHVYVLSRSRKQWRKHFIVSDLQ